MDQLPQPGSVVHTRDRSSPEYPTRPHIDDSMDHTQTLLKQALSSLNLDQLRREYQDNDEFLLVEKFLPDQLLSRWHAELDTLRPTIHRNFIPRHKKGGSVDFNTIRALAPTIHAVYSSPEFFKFIEKLTGAKIQYCPESDLHRCALYAYTEPGDHIGWHYDTSYYRGRRFTVLLGLVDESSSRLAYRLHTRNNGHEVVEGETATPPGSLVVFDGDKLHHAVTPLGEGEQRFVITMEFVTDGSMNWFLRFVSNMKDAIAYFGFGKVFGGRRRLQAHGIPASAPPATKNDLAKSEKAC